MYFCVLHSSLTSIKSHLLLRFVAGNLHPDHGTIANFRKVFLSETQDLFVCILLLSQTAGALMLRIGMQISITNLHQHRNAWRISVGTGGRFAIGMGGGFELYRMPDEGLNVRLAGRRALCCVHPEAVVRQTCL